MKKILFIALTALIITGCKKVVVEELPIKKVAVKFNVSGFTQTNAPFEKLSATNPVTKWYTLIYVVYNSSGKEVSRQYQTMQGAKFEAVSDSLTAGTYTVAVIAAAGGINLNTRYSYSPDSEDGTWVLPLEKAYVEFSRGLDCLYRTRDLFYKKITVNVGEQGVEQSIELERSVGKLELIIEDADKTSNLIRVNLLNEAEGLYLNTGLPYSQISDDIHQNIQIGTYDVINTVDPIKLSIIVWDQETWEVISQRIVEVKVNKNGSDPKVVD